jgi:hypothetical protein
MTMNVFQRFRWLLGLWMLLAAVIFVPPATFAYDALNQLTVAYDGSGESDAGYDAVSVPATSEKKSGVTGDRVLFAKFERFLAAKEAPLVRGADEAFNSALFQEATRTVENVGGFRLYGNKGLVGDTFTRNVFLVEAETKGAASLRGFVNALEGEARAAGAKQLSIVGHQVINPGFLNPAVAQRFGFTFRQVNETTIQLVKPLP